MDKKDKLIALSQWLIVQEAEIGCFWQTLKKKSICAHKKKSQLNSFGIPYGKASMRPQPNLLFLFFSSLNYLDLFFIWSSQNETFNLLLNKNKLAFVN